MSHLSTPWPSTGSTLTGDRQRLLDKYEFVDLARKVVGVGSVGTRCWVALFVGRDHGDPLFLQIKEAEAAVGEAFLATSEYSHHGQRVVEGQRLMQGASDIFLGWDQLRRGGRRHPRLLPPPAVGLEAVGRRRPMPPGHAGHLRPDVRVDAGPGPRPVRATPSPSAAYLGGGDRFDRAMCEFAAAYADQNERDFAALTQAIADGRIHAVSGV